MSKYDPIDVDVIVEDDEGEDSDSDGYIDGEVGPEDVAEHYDADLFADEDEEEVKSERDQEIEDNQFAWNDKLDTYAPVPGDYHPVNRQHMMSAFDPMEHLFVEDDEDDDDEVFGMEEDDDDDCVIVSRPTLVRSNRGRRRLRSSDCAKVAKELGLGRYVRNSR